MKACSHFSMGIIKPFFLCHFVFALQYPNMRYHVSPGVCPPQIVIAAPWPNSGHRELPSVELVPKVLQGKGISRSHCSPSSSLIFYQYLCPYGKFSVVICSRDYNQRPCLQMASVAMLISPVLASGRYTVPLCQRGTEDCVEYFGICKILFFNKMCMMEKLPLVDVIICDDSNQDR